MISGGPKRRNSHFELRVHAERYGWILREPKDVWIKGSRLGPEVAVYRNEAVPRVLFVPEGRVEFAMSVPVSLIKEKGIKARWLYHWEEAEVAGVMLMLDYVVSQYITPLPVSVLEVSDGEAVV